MTTDRVEFMLEQLSKAQRQLVTYLAWGFATGFCIGVLTAYLMFSLSRP